MKFALLTTLLSLYLIPVSASAAPKLAIDAPIFDFGTITQGKKVEHVFTLKNTGDAPLRIKQVRPSCGCTAVNISSATIQPGGKGEIRSSFNSAKFSGKVKKEIAVETNDPATPSYNLTLSGIIQEEIEIIPKTLDFGRMKTTTPKTMQFTMHNNVTRPITIMAVNSSLPQATVKTGKNIINPGETVPFFVTVTPRETDRVISGYVNLNTDHPSRQNISVPFYGSPQK